MRKDRWNLLLLVDVIRPSISWCMSLSSQKVAKVQIKCKIIVENLRESAIMWGMMQRQWNIYLAKRFFVFLALSNMNNENIQITDIDHRHQHNNTSCFCYTEWLHIRRVTIQIRQQETTLQLFCYLLKNVSENGLCNKQCSFDGATL